jgi:RHS repeat-associated protein
MHEHLDEMGIINMNGRIYDPLIGRFMSADPYIQAPDNLQSHNRYAYVMNNPLNLDDPSGYWSISKAWKKVWKSPIFKAVLGIVVAFVAPYALAYFAPSLFVLGSLPTALATGALSGFASTGTLKGALTGAFTAGIMFGVGEIAHGLGLAKAGTEAATAGSMLGRTALHAGAGCLNSVVGGGSCKAGAISGALGEIGTHLPGSDNYAFGVAKGAMLGGLGSKLAGGKFEDGAATGAFGYMFNHAMEHGAFGPIRDFFNKGMTKLNNAINDNALQAGSGGGGTAAFIIGGSVDVSPTVSTNGSCAVVVSLCAIAGPIAAATVDVNALTVSKGSPGNGWNVNLVGKGSLPVGLGLQGTLGYGSDGLQAQAGQSYGLAAGFGLKVCKQGAVKGC